MVVLCLSAMMSFPWTAPGGSVDNPAGGDATPADDDGLVRILQCLM